uniref:Uncharacterized protein n=1 Tax=Rhipicephalus zambeziensis TaxID=60191 RepID=A0A224YE47_9ACAR
MERAAYTRSNNCGSCSRSSCVCLCVRFARLCVRAARFKCRAVTVSLVYAHFVRPVCLRYALHVSSCLPFFTSHYNLLLQHSFLLPCGETMHNKRSTTYVNTRFTFVLYRFL